MHINWEWPSLCSSGQVPGHRYKSPGFDSRRYQIFWEVVGLEQGPVSLMSTTEELLGRNSSGSSLENREYGCGDPLCWPRDTLYPQKLALTSPSGGLLVGIFRSQTKATEFIFINWQLNVCALQDKANPEVLLFF
jgi:hypothetical protein